MLAQEKGIRGIVCVPMITTVILGFLLFELSYKYDDLQLHLNNTCISCVNYEYQENSCWCCSSSPTYNQTSYCIATAFDCNDTGLIGNCQTGWNSIFAHLQTSIIGYSIGISLCAAVIVSYLMIMIVITAFYHAARTSRQSRKVNINKQELEIPFFFATPVQLSNQTLDHI